MTGKIKKFFCGFVLASALPLFAQTYDLPLIIVNTNGKTLEKGADKIPATMRILDNGTNSVADSAKGELMNIGIKIRGQTSADFPKKGYGLELKARACQNVADTACHDTSLKVLGMPKNADWVFHGLRTLPERAIQGRVPAARKNQARQVPRAYRETQGRRR